VMCKFLCDTIVMIAASFLRLCADSRIIDGVVIDVRTMPGGDYPIYHLGDTAVHEVRTGEFEYRRLVLGDLIGIFLPSSGWALAWIVSHVSRYDKQVLDFPTWRLLIDSVFFHLL
jgi:hypothetical protein